MVLVEKTEDRSQLAQSINFIEFIFSALQKFRFVSAYTIIENRHFLNKSEFGLFNFFLVIGDKLKKFLNDLKFF